MSQQPYYASKVHRTLIIYVLILLVLSPLQQAVFAQCVGTTCNDGPIELRAKVRRINVNLATGDDAATFVCPFPSAPPLDIICGPDGAFNDELSMWLRGKGSNDPAYSGSAKHEDFYFFGGLEPPTIVNTPDYDSIFFDTLYTGATIPTWLDVGVDAWEDDIPSDFNFIPISCTGPIIPLPPCPFGGFGEICDSCQTVNNPIALPEVFNPTRDCWSTDGTCIDFAGNWTEDDDLHCDAPNFTQLDYRLGPPCQWYAHNAGGFITGACPTNNIYQPQLQTFWRYTKGTACTATESIPLGSVGPGSGTVLQHFNSNECYGDNFTAAMGGVSSNDVFYSFEITGPLGINISTCGTGTSFNTVLHLLDASCTVVDSIDGGCGGGAGGSAFMNTLICPGTYPATYYIVVEGGTPADMGTFDLIVSEDPDLTLRANAGSDPSAICDGDSLIIGQPDTIAALGGLGPDYLFSWTPIAPNIVTQPDSANTQVTVITGPGSYTFTLAVTDVTSGCVATDVVIVNVKPDPQPNFGPDVEICDGDSVAISPGLGYDTYIWLNPPAADTHTVTVYEAGSYAVLVDSNACFATDVILVTFRDTLVSGLIPDTTICDQTSITLDGTDPSHPPATTYTWHDGSTGTTFLADTSGTYSIVITEAGLCETRDTFVLSIDTLPVPDLGPDTSICFGVPYLLDAGTAFADHVFTLPGGAMVNNQTLNATSAGSYSVIVTDLNNCEGTDTMNIATFPTSILNLGPDDTICGGETVTLMADSCLSGLCFGFVWNTTDTTQTIDVTNTGVYWVDRFDEFNCIQTDTISIEVVPTDPLDLGRDTSYCNSTGILLSAGAGFDSYDWFIDDSLIVSALNSPTLETTSPGTYSVNVYTGGCELTGEISVIRDCPQALTVPNVFSPNADGINDLMLLEGDNLELYNLKIYTRWGNLVFESTEISNSWDGTRWGSGAKQMPEGVYIMVLEYQFLGAEKSFKESGTVTLMR